MPAMLASPHVLPVLLLIASNVFMTFAWYGHLRYKAVPLAGVILASWAIAFIEYCMAVPANRWGSAVYSTAQLKTMQEVITLVVFAGSPCSTSRSRSAGITHSASRSSPPAHRWFSRNGDGAYGKPWVTLVGNPC